LLLSLVNVSHRFTGRKTFWGAPETYVYALNDVSLDIERGEILGVVGESGCGKSTLGRCAIGLIRPTEGNVEWDGNDISDSGHGSVPLLRSSYQMVFQNPYASLNPRQKTKSMLEEALHKVKRKKEIGPHDGIITTLIERVGLSVKDLNKYPHQFSGGQRQRIALARVLALNPKLIILDEPLSSLDVTTQSSILNLLKAINERTGVGYLFISHDLRIVGDLSDRVAVMYLGKIVELGPTDKVLEQPRHPYTQVLLAASEGKHIFLNGDPPSPTKLLQTCPFTSRCPLVENRCKESPQKLEKIGENWRVACWKALR
jgi:oligopeptide/dipeptide ABC transporter ATP-binding protein